MARLNGILRATLFLLPCALLLTGCADPEPPRLKIQGEVLNKGEPLKVKPMVGRVQVTFIRVTEPGSPPVDPQEAVVKPDGTFTVPGTDGKGIAPGKYKVAVRQWDEFPTKDTLNGKFDKEHTTIIREVTGEEDILIDVGKE